MLVAHAPNGPTAPGLDAALLLGERASFFFDTAERYTTKRLRA